jgi:hypothetical protein
MSQRPDRNVPPGAGILISVAFMSLVLVVATVAVRSCLKWM